MRFENDAQGMAVDYHELRNAVSLGGDSDTLACITGGIAETFYEMPPELQQETLKRLLEEMQAAHGTVNGSTAQNDSA